MDHASLVEEDIKDGERLVHALDQAGFDVSAAFWLFVEESDTYRLFLASTLVDEKGATHAYERIGRALENDPSGLSLREISVLSPEDPRVRVMRGVIHTGCDLASIRFSRNVVDGIYVHDALIYRMT